MVFASFPAEGLTHVEHPLVVWLKDIDFEREKSL